MTNLIGPDISFYQDDDETVIAVTFVQKFVVGDYFEFWCWGDNTGVKLLATAAGTSPTRPAVPSIIMTANYIGYD